MTGRLFSPNDFLKVWLLINPLAFLGFKLCAKPIVYILLARTYTLKRCTHIVLQCKKNGKRKFETKEAMISIV